MDNDVHSMEENQIQQHQHDDNGHDHGAESTSEAEQHRHSYEVLGISSNDSYVHLTCHMDIGYSCIFHKSGYMQTSSTKVKVTTKTNVYSSKSNVGGVTGASRSGIETRPRNMNIIYIMRVF